MKIKKIEFEKLNQEEPVYDLTVKSANHNFQLANGVFVHNSLQVPKQYFGQTNDSAGFNGGTSLTIISSEYGKRIVKVQQVLRQIVTDIVNLFLIDRGMLNYVNKFKIMMQTPVTQEEIDKRSNLDSKVRYIGEIMSQLNDIEDPIIKLKIYKKLLGNAINDPAVISDIDEYIKKKEGELKKSDKTPSDNTSEELPSFESEEETTEVKVEQEEENPVQEEIEKDTEDKETLLERDGDNSDKDSYLPTPKELGIE